MLARGLIVRTILTWLVLAAGFFSCFAVSAFSKMIWQAFGADYPRTLSQRLPVTTQNLLDHHSIILNFPAFNAAIGALATVAALKFASTVETRLYYLTLTAAYLLHMSFMSALMFQMMFFLLPKMLNAA